ncbi:MAG TPA: FCD domain-containing protein [Clostridia bacterium]|nr:FCD domain-containing protein [Clostridia bacterium]
MVFKKIDYRSMVDTVVDQVMDQILGGQLKVGDRIPPEVEFAKMMGVGRSTVREALKVLEGFSLVSRSNEGTFISNPESGSLGKLFDCITALKQIELEDLLEVRLILEARVVEIAAQRVADGEDLSEELRLIKDLVSLENSKQATIEEMAQINVNFHMALVNCTDNTALIEILNMLRPVFMQSQYVTLESQILREGGASEGHISIIDAIEKGDPVRAMERMRSHIISAYHDIERGK